ADPLAAGGRPLRVGRRGGIRDAGAFLEAGARHRLMRALVTGASRGLGLALCRVLAERGDEVLAACRQATPELAQLGVTSIEGIDVAEDGSIRRLGDAVGVGPIEL